MKKRGIKYHIVHKSRLTLLLLLKVIFVLLSFFAVMLAISIIPPWVNLYKISLSSIVIFAIGLALVILVYLVMIIRILKVLKFQ